MKTKINVPGELEKFKIASKVADVTVLETEQYGTVSVAVITYRHAQQLIFLGSLLDKVEKPSVIDEKPIEKATEKPEVKETVKEEVKNVGAGADSKKK